ncbi:MAG: carbohydrate kinase family protein [Candidatus Diapherotrites archaeon]|nr:carbohydrate kinase family protein [Candidatus Diapherotrites archaeon]
MMLLLDVVSIGNATLDVFIHLSREHLKGKKLCLASGSKIEVNKIFFATGGGATNTAVGFARLGLKTGIVAAIGKDDNAKRILHELKKEKVDCSGIVTLKKFKTAYSAILTGFGGDRIILTFGGATTHLEKESRIKWGLLKKAGWFYVSSFHSKPKILKKIFEFANNNSTLVMWNPGKSELKQGLKLLRPLLKRTTIISLNKIEAEMLTKKSNVKQNLKSLQKIVPLVIITLGKEGSIAFDGKKFYRQRARKAKVVDSAGCGDAFNSGFLAAIIRGKTVSKALLRGTQNAESVIKHLGAKNNLLRKKNY